MRRDASVAASMSSRIRDVRWMRCALLLSAFAAGCSGIGRDASGGWAGPPPDGASDAGSDRPTPPPTELRTGQPAATARRILVADEDGDTLSVIEADSLRLQVVRTTPLPRQVRAIPHREAAVLISAASRVLQEVDLDATPPRVATRPVPARCSRLDVSPDGAHALLWQCGGRDAEGSTQEVVLARLTSDAVHTLSVAQSVDDVRFAADGSRAVLVMARGVHDVNLAAVGSDTLLLPIDLPTWEGGSRRTVAGDARHVLITPAGADDASEAIVFDIEAAAGTTITLDATSALQASASTRGDASWAVRTGGGRIALLQVLPDGSVDVTERDTGLASIRSLRWDGNEAMITGQGPASEGARARLVVVASTGEPEAYRLALPATDALASEDGRIAVVLHEGGSRVSVVRRDLGYVKLEEVPGTVERVVIRENASPASVWIATRDRASAGTLVRLEQEALVRSDFPLGGEPVELGGLGESGPVFVSVRHPLGRIVFAGPGADQERVVTGFGLNAEVE